MSKRILIVSDSIKRQTGYATVASNIIKNLQKQEDYIIAQLGLADIPVPPEHQPTIHYYSGIKQHIDCCHRGQVIEYWNPDKKVMTFLIPNLFTDEHPDQTAYCPKAGNFANDAYGQDAVFPVIQHFKPDIVIAINDIWGLYHFNYLKHRKQFIFIPYLAIDSECFPIDIPAHRPDLPKINTINCIGASNKVVVFTDWAKDTINHSAKIVLDGKSFTNIEVIPHGVDISQFRPLENKDALREKYFGLKPNDGTIIIGSIQRNQPRKRLDAIFQTLDILKQKYSSSYKKILCHFHCAMEDKAGWNLPWLARYYNVVEMCVFDDRLRPGFGVPVNILNEIVNCYDIHLTLTNSEGWGLPILETMAAGVPNIVTDYSAHADWTQDAALKVKIAARIHEIKTDHIKGIADINHAAKTLSLMCSSNKMREEYSRKALKRARELEWSRVCDEWIELINSLDTSSFEDNRYNLLKTDLENLPQCPSDIVQEPFILPEI